MYGYESRIPENLVGKRIMYRSMYDKRSGLVVKAWGDDCVRVKTSKGDEATVVVNVLDIVRVFED